MTTNNQISAPISLTEAAAARVSTFLGKDGGRALYIDVRRTGCSGWAYDLDIAKREAADDEHVFVTTDGIEIIATSRALSMMKGTIIDFVREGLVEEFRFKNPNVAAECGCGESFTIVDPSGQNPSESN